MVYVEDNPSNIAFMDDMLADLERVQLLTAPTAIKQLKLWPETRDIPVVALSAAAMVQDAKRVRGAGFYR